MSAEKILNAKQCTMDDIGLRITGEDAAPAIECISEYLSSFVGGKLCPNCDEELGGLLGSFRWGMVTGEGNCSCGWPCRGLHEICNEEGDKIFNRPLNIVLAYHPKMTNLGGE